MKLSFPLLPVTVFGLLVTSIPAFAADAAAPAAAPAAKPYKILATTQIPAAGGIDYVNADGANRRVYVACGNTVSVFDLDTYKLVGSLPNASGHGVAIDPENHTGLVSGNPATFFNTKTLEPIKTVPTPRADGYIFDAPTHHFFILTHGDPNVYVVDSKDGSLVTTINHLGKNDTAGAIEQGASDGQGHLYFDVEDQACIAVVDAATLKVTGHYDLGDKGSSPAGLALDAKNHILFAMCRGSAATGGPTCVILSATDGKIITTLPLAGSSDGGTFNPETLEAFSSHGNGTLSVIKENSPTSFEVEQTVTTKSSGKTCTLDAKTGHIVVIALEAAPTPAAPAASSASAASSAAPAASGTAPAAASATPAASAGSGQVAAAAPAASGARGGRGGRGGARGPQLLDVLFIGR